MWYLKNLLNPKWIFEILKTGSNDLQGLIAKIKAWFWFDQQTLIIFGICFLFKCLAPSEGEGKCIGSYDKGIDNVFRLKTSDITSAGGNDLEKGIYTGVGQGMPWIDTGFETTGDQLIVYADGDYYPWGKAATEKTTTYHPITTRLGDTDIWITSLQLSEDYQECELNTDIKYTQYDERSVKELYENHLNKYTIINPNNRSAGFAHVMLDRTKSADPIQADCINHNNCEIDDTKDTNPIGCVLRRGAGIYMKFGEQMPFSYHIINHDVPSLQYVCDPTGANCDYKYVKLGENAIKTTRIPFTLPIMFYRRDEIDEDIRDTQEEINGKLVPYKLYDKQTNYQFTFLQPEGTGPCSPSSTDPLLQEMNGQCYRSITRSMTLNEVQDYQCQKQSITDEKHPDEFCPPPKGQRIYVKFADTFYEDDEGSVDLIFESGAKNLAPKLKYEINGIKLSWIQYIPYKLIAPFWGDQTREDDPNQLLEKKTEIDHIEVFNKNGDPVYPVVKNGTHIIKTTRFGEKGMRLCGQDITPTGSCPKPTTNILTAYHQDIDGFNHKVTFTPKDATVSLGDIKEDTVEPAIESWLISIDRLNEGLFFKVRDKILVSPFFTFAKIFFALWFVFSFGIGFLNKTKTLAMPTYTKNWKHFLILMWATDPDNYALIDELLWPALFRYAERFAAGILEIGTSIYGTSLHYTNPYEFFDESLQMMTSKQLIYKISSLANDIIYWPVYLGWFPLLGTGIIRYFKTVVSWIWSLTLVLMDLGQIIMLFPFYALISFFKSHEGTLKKIMIRTLHTFTHLAFEMGFFCILMGFIYKAFLEAIDIDICWRVKFSFSLFDLFPIIKLYAWVIDGINSVFAAYKEIFGGLLLGVVKFFFLSFISGWCSTIAKMAADALMPDSMASSISANEEIVGKPVMKLFDTAMGKAGDTLDLNKIGSGGGGGLESRSGIKSGNLDSVNGDPSNMIEQAKNIPGGEDMLKKIGNQRPEDIQKKYIQNDQMKNALKQVKDTDISKDIQKEIQRGGDINKIAKEIGKKQGDINNIMNAKNDEKNLLQKTNTKQTDQNVEGVGQILNRQILNNSTAKNEPGGIKNDINKNINENKKNIIKNDNKKESKLKQHEKQRKMESEHKVQKELKEKKINKPITTKDSQKKQQVGNTPEEKNIKIIKKDKRTIKTTKITESNEKQIEKNLIIESNGEKTIKENAYNKIERPIGNETNKAVNNNTQSIKEQASKFDNNQPNTMINSEQTQDINKIKDYQTVKTTNNIDEQLAKPIQPSDKIAQQQHEYYDNHIEPQQKQIKKIDQTVSSSNSTDKLPHKKDNIAINKDNIVMDNGHQTTKTPTQTRNIDENLHENINYKIESHQEIKPKTNVEYQEAYDTSEPKMRQSIDINRTTNIDNNEKTQPSDITSNRIDEKITVETIENSNKKIITENNINQNIEHSDDKKPKQIVANNVKQQQKGEERPLQAKYENINTEPQPQQDIATISIENQPQLDNQPPHEQIQQNDRMQREIIKPDNATQRELKYESNDVRQQQKGEDQPLQAKYESNYIEVQTHNNIERTVNSMKNNNNNTVNITINGQTINLDNNDLGIQPVENNNTNASTIIINNGEVNIDRPLEYKTETPNYFEYQSNNNDLSISVNNNEIGVNNPNTIENNGAITTVYQKENIQPDVTNDNINTNNKQHHSYDDNDTETDIKSQQPNIENQQSAINISIEPIQSKQVKDENINTEPQPQQDTATISIENQPQLDNQPPHEQIQQNDRMQQEEQPLQDKYESNYTEQQVLQTEIKSYDSNQPQHEITNINAIEQPISHNQVEAIKSKHESNYTEPQPQQDTATTISIENQSQLDNQPPHEQIQQNAEMQQEEQSLQAKYESSNIVPQQEATQQDDWSKQEVEGFLQQVHEQIKEIEQTDVFLTNTSDHIHEDQGAQQGTEFLVQDKTNTNDLTVQIDTSYIDNQPQAQQENKSNNDTVVNTDYTHDASYKDNSTLEPSTIEQNKKYSNSDDSINFDSNLVSPNQSFGDSYGNHTETPVNTETTVVVDTNIQQNQDVSYTYNGNGNEIDIKEVKENNIDQSYKDYAEAKETNIQTEEKQAIKESIEENFDDKNNQNNDFKKEMNANLKQKIEEYQKDDTKKREVARQINFWANNKK